MAGEKWRRIIDLRGQWKFSLGDDMKWADPNYNDDNWKTIYVPSAWEDEGYPGYDGYAWYRVKFRINKEDANKNIYLRLWQIDDVDEVFVNGHSIGISGSFPPHYASAYSKDRNYRIPKQILFPDRDNTISIRVYDEYQRGGIVKGKVGIYEIGDVPQPDLPLDGLWKFMPGDNDYWKDFGYDDDQWYRLIVPSFWEGYGFKDLDGYAWYRKDVNIPEEYKGKKLILFLGQIDDLDQTFFNGVLVGEIGTAFWEDKDFQLINEWRLWRKYPLDQELIRYGEKNVIAVRVFDARRDGGIYKGPIGIVTEKNLRNWKLGDNVEYQKKGYFEEWF
jgi:sialate O-acetylesterase